MKQSPVDTGLSVSCLDHIGQSSSTVHPPRFTVKFYTSRRILLLGRMDVQTDSLGFLGEEPFQDGQ